MMRPAMLRRTFATMRLEKALLLGLVIASLAGCGGGSAPAASGPGTPAASSGGLAPSITKDVQAAARPAAAHFYSVYSASKFTDSWHLLAVAARKQIPLRVWEGVHRACSSAGNGEPRVIKAVTLFGNAAIVTSVESGAPPKGDVTEDVFNYADGRWGYSPQEIGIYEHGSVRADIAAAKAARLCAGWKSF